MLIATLLDAASFCVPPTLTCESAPIYDLKRRSLDGEMRPEAPIFDELVPLFSIFILHLAQYLWSGCLTCPKRTRLF